MPTSSSGVKFSAATAAYAASSARPPAPPRRVQRPPLPQLQLSSSASSSSAAAASAARFRRAKSTGCVNGAAAATAAAAPSKPLGQLNGSNAGASLRRPSNGRRGSLALEDRGLAGLNNLGNTCYMNSIVQCLSHTRPLLELLLVRGGSGCEPPTSPSTYGRLASAYRRLVRDMWSSGAPAVVSPAELRSGVARLAPRFRGSGQQDAQEFLRYLLEGLHEELARGGPAGQRRRPRLPAIDYQELDLMPDPKKSELLWQRYTTLEDSPIVDLFVGQLKSTLECCHCQHKSTTFDPFWDLALPIPRHGSHATLAACLDLFTTEETLDGNERPKCDSCNTRRRCLKSFSLYRLPRILVIHLKRFSGDRFRTKLNTLVDYPMELDLAPYVDSGSQASRRSRYALYAVSEHSGTPSGGHYTAVVRHAYASPDRWLAFNDSLVSRAGPAAAVSPRGYVLFYEQLGGAAAS